MKELVIGIMILILGCSLISRKDSPALLLPMEISHPIDKIDPSTIGAEFPGNRGAHELVIYTSAYGERTGTNPWGYEAIVSGTIVVRLNRQNSPIPDDGFVISGHGDAAAWIISAIKPGAHAKVDGARLVISYPVDSVRAVTRAEIQDTLARLKETELLADEQSRVMDYIEEADAFLEKSTTPTDLRKARNLALQAYSSALQAAFAMIPRRTDEIRSAWVRLEAETPGDIRAFVKKIQEAHLTIIFPETIFEGYTLYPSPDGMIPQHPMYRGWDPLKILIEECHKAGIEVHAWCHIFFIGFDSPLIASHPGWLARDRSGAATSILEKGYHYFCPANEQARAFLQENFVYLVSHYDLDGFQFDYIRYPQSQFGKQEFCFCPLCRQEFSNHHPGDLLKLDPDEDAELWHAWNEKRRHDIDTFARDTIIKLRDLKSGIYLSADVFPRPEEAMNNVFQPWFQWAKEGLFDLLCPMAYTTLASELEIELKEFRQMLPETTPVAIGLGYFLYRDIPILARQIELTRKYNFAGQVIFALNHFSPDDYSLLGELIYTENNK